MESALDTSPLFGLWTVWEPNAFDGQDASYKNSLGHDETGRFLPYFYRYDGGIVLEAAIDYEAPGDGDYYWVPKTTGLDYVTEPMWYDLGVGTVGMISLVTPVLVNNVFVGAVGVDFDLNMLQDLAEGVRLFQTGYGRLLSNQGTIAAHPDSRVIGDLADELQDAVLGKRVLDTIGQGELFSAFIPSSADKQTTFRSFAPIRVGNAPNFWTFSAVVPHQEMTANGDRVVRIAILVTIVGIILLTLIVLAVSQQLVKPILRLVDVAMGMDKGDLTTEVPPLLTKSKDEMGVLARTFEHVLLSLRQSMELLESSISKTAETAENLSATSEENSATIEEIASSMHQFADVVTKVRQRTDGVQLQIREVKELSLKGVSQMDGNASSMDSIHQSSLQAADAIHALSLQADSINKVIALIATVSEQTNLLALNAAIEAARAGEQGRGFAVVADEVRALAEQTTSSVADIRNTVQSLQEQVKHTVGLIRSTQKEARSGMVVASEAKKSFDGIRTRIDETVSRVQEIAEHSQSMDQTGTEISSAVEQQSASMEEIAATTQDLTSIASELQTLVRRYTIR